MDEEYYIKEIVKLLGIVEQEPNDGTIHRIYIKEKLERIIHGIGVGIHPSLEPWVKEYISDRNRRFLK